MEVVADSATQGLYATAPLVSPMIANEKTASEPLLVRDRGGWRWGPWRDFKMVDACCVVARALGKTVDNPQVDARLTALGRTLDQREAEAIFHVDNGWGTDADREVILYLAKKMGVEA